MPEIVLLFFVGSVVGFFALYWLISLETATPEVVDRETAEREAREIGRSHGSRGRRRSDRREPPPGTDERDGDDGL